MSIVAPAARRVGDQGMDRTLAAGDPVVMAAITASRAVSDKPRSRRSYVASTSAHGPGSKRAGLSRRRTVRLAWIAYFADLAEAAIALTDEGRLQGG